MDETRARVVKQINCVFHKGDNTASLTLYTDGRYYCFGCTASGKCSDLGLDIQGEITNARPRPREDIRQSLERIANLPTKPIRGLNLPTDDSGYYIVWPDRSYYVKRFFDSANSGRKYHSPSGHTKPLFQLTGTTDCLVVVEGQINALSIRSALPDLECCSPGGAGDFTKSEYAGYRGYYRSFRKILILADADTPGLKAAYALSRALIKDGIPDVTFRLMKEDANDILTKYGAECLRQTITSYLEMPVQMPSNQDTLSASGASTATTIAAKQASNSKG